MSWLSFIDDWPLLVAGPYWWLAWAQFATAPPNEGPNFNRRDFMRRDFMR